MMPTGEWTLPTHNVSHCSQSLVLALFLASSWRISRRCFLLADFPVQDPSVIPVDISLWVRPVRNWQFGYFAVKNCLEDSLCDLNLPNWQNITRTIYELENHKLFCFCSTMIETWLKLNANHSENSTDNNE